MTLYALAMIQFACSGHDSACNLWPQLRLYALATSTAQFANSGHIPFVCSAGRFNSENVDQAKLNIAVTSKAGLILSSGLEAPKTDE